VRKNQDATQRGRVTNATKNEERTDGETRSATDAVAVSPSEDGDLHSLVRPEGGRGGLGAGEAPSNPDVTVTSSGVLKPAPAGTVRRCECGEETSCYGCLRNFRNQAFHEQLRRGDALTFLGRLVK